MKPKIVITSVALFSILSLTSCDELAKVVEAAGSKAPPAVLTHGLKSDAWLVNKEFDWGYQVALQLKNNGETGAVITNVTLSTSEGEWTRTQTVVMTAGETKDLSYTFTEPTVNATNIQYRITTLP